MHPRDLSKYDIFFFSALAAQASRDDIAVAERRSKKGPKTVKIEGFWPFRPFSSVFFLTCDSHYVGNRSPFFKMHPRDLSKYDVFFLVLRQRGRPPKRLSRIQGPKKGPKKAQKWPKMAQNGLKIEKKSIFSFRREMH